jgi:8-oxo-dGTP pyrophosphatase MutT (NUDIX family)
MRFSNSRPSRTVQHVSAGGVATRWLNGRLQVVLVGTAEPARWGLPKGTPNEGETLDQVAIREVREETGLEVRILEPLGEIAYWFSVRRVRHHKTVHFYLMEAIGGDTSRHDSEYEYAEWFDADEALQIISFPNEAGVLAQAIERAMAILSKSHLGAELAEKPPSAA